MDINRNTLKRKLNAAGVPSQRSADWVPEAIRLHLEGVPQTEIARRLGRQQAGVSAALTSRGYRTDRGEAERRKWAGMTAEQRAAQVTAAHDAVRGSTKEYADLCARALTKQERLIGATEEEGMLAAALGARGIATVQQQAVGKYNLDVGAAPVAVELFGGGWHAYGTHAARLPQRVKDIADAGWNMLIIWTHTGARGVFPLHLDAAAQDAAAYYERSSRDPSFRRQYRVIWGTGQLLAAGSVDDDQVTLVPTGIRGAYSARR
jgi:hypothetical protein